MGPPFIPDSGLPAALTPLVGRASDVAAVAASLRQPEVRLATLTGPGGVGKTRLALEAVAALSGDFPDGVRFISLAAIVDPDLLALTIVQQLGLAPAAATPPEARLAWFLRDRALLLVLDNFEQIVDAAPILTELLAACPKMKMLVTSRVRLRLSGEHEHVVPPLALVERGGVSSLERARASAAVQLFVARAQATNDAFVLSADNAAAIAAICDRLDGLPLAIELAAARVKTLPPAALLARLERRLPLLTGGARDLPARQQTMRDAIAWSHALLAPAAPSLFRRLAVFVGGFTVEAAAALLDPAADAAIGALDEVNALVDASLVRPEATTTGEPRFLMLETIREYAAERLVASGEEAMMRRAHAAYFLRWAEDVRGDRSRNLAPAALPLIAAEHDNLRAALEWALTSDDPDIALRLAAAIWRFWFVRGHATEGRAWLDRCLARERAAASPALAEALYAAASLAFDQIDLAPAIAFSERAENAFHHAGDTLAAIRAREVRALAIWEAGDRDQGDALLAETLAAFRASDAPAEVAACLNEIGINFSNRGQLDRAASMWEEAAAIHRGLGVTLDTGVVLGNLALVAADRGDAAAALALKRESLAIFAEQNSLRAIFGALEEMAALAGHWGDQDTAARLLGAADGLRRAIGIPIAPSYRAEYDQIVASVRGGMDEARFAASWANGRSLPLADALALADAVTVPPAPPRREPAPHGLSPREAEVVRLIVDGRSNQEIANALFISHRTASTHVRNILTKLDLDSRTAVAAWAIRRGLA